MDGESSPESAKEVLEIFDVDGSPASILRLEAKDINAKDLAEHAMNLAETNFRLLEDVPHAKTRAAIRERMFLVRERMKNLPVIGDCVQNSPLAEKTLNAVYPDWSREEHFRSGRDRRLPEMMSERRMLGVELNGRIVAVQGYKHVGQTESGRPVYEFTKASTLDDPACRGKRFNPRLKKAIFEEIMGEHPNAMWVSASVNAAHLGKFKERGWHLVEMNDSNEAVKAMNETRPKEDQDLMIKLGFKAVYFDPNVDSIEWE